MSNHLNEYVTLRLELFTCVIRYVVDLDRLKEFEEYAATWMRLIQRYGGIHHGYFLPVKGSKEVSDSSFSFPEVSKAGPGNVAIALYSFSSLEKYETYRKEVKNDEECKYITKRVLQIPCFVSYERTYLNPLFPDDISSSKFSDL